MDERTIDDRVTAYERDTTRPADADDLFRGMADKQRRGTLAGLVVSLLLIALGVLEFLVPDRWYVAVLVTALSTAWFALQLIVWVRGVRLLSRLRGTMFREVPVTDPRAARSKVCFPLTDREAWVTVRLPLACRLLLAGVRRAWVLGPDRGGRVLVTFPGVLSTWPGKVRQDAVPGARPMSAPPRTWASPKDDPILAAHVRGLITRTLTWGGVPLIVFGALAWLFLLAGSLDIAVGAAATTVVCLLWTSLALLGFTRARAVGEWTEIEADLDGPPRIGAQGTVRGKGSVRLPDGGTATLVLPRVPAEIYAHIRDARRLWIIGEPRQATVAWAGLPGYPVLGRVKIGVRLETRARH